MQSLITDQAYQALQYLLVAGVLGIVFNIGKTGTSNGIRTKREGMFGLSEDVANDDFEIDTKSLITRLSKGILIILFIAVVSGSILLGTTSDCDGSDPLRGFCTTTQEFKPTEADRLVSVVYMFSILGIPYLFGGYSKYKQIKSGEAEDQLKYEKFKDKLSDIRANKALKEMEDQTGKAGK